MKRDGFLSRALLALAIAVLLYAISYTVIERRRASNGPWQVTFTQDETGAPAILINQATIGITNVQIRFPGSSNAITNRVELRDDHTALRAPVTVTFHEARKTPFDVPFGECVFLDTVFLPGTVVFETFGHQIQLMPRVLTIDGAEYSWQARVPFELKVNTNSNALPK